MNALFTITLVSLIFVLNACSTTFSSMSGGATAENKTGSNSTVATAPASVVTRTKPHPSGREKGLTNQRQDVLMYTLGLLGTGYRFGGKNPEAGLDCSGMVSFIYTEATNFPLRGNAANMAKAGRKISLMALLPGDLVFFNTQQRPYSHVGIFIGEGRFVHAPSTNGKIRVDRLDTGYFAKQFEEARTYFD
jgi:cell wall-associated NlpC family hydrolase